MDNLDTRGKNVSLNIHSIRRFSLTLPCSELSRSFRGIRLSGRGIRTSFWATRISFERRACFGGVWTSFGGIRMSFGRIGSPEMVSKRCCEYVLILHWRHGLMLLHRVDCWWPSTLPNFVQGGCSDLPALPNQSAPEDLCNVLEPTPCCCCRKSDLQYCIVHSHSIPSPDAGPTQSH